MLDLPRPDLPVLARFALALGLVLSAHVTVLGRDRDPVGQPLYDIVAVGRGRGKILLATLAIPAQKMKWRFREIPVSPSDSTARDVVLSAGGTKALVVFSDGTPRVFDLTKRITGITVGVPSAPQHRLPGQLFPYVASGKVCLLDDLGYFDENKCRTATAAAIHEDGRVLYALNDGRLIVAAPNGDSQELLPYRLTQGAQFQLLAGHQGDTRDFLVLLTVPSVAQIDATTAPVTEVIDPRLPAAPLARFTNSTVATLHAQLEFASKAPALEPPRPILPNEATLSALAAQLDEQTRPAEFTWSFTRVVVNKELYAPVLEFAPGEPDYPSDVGIWQEIRPLAHGASRESYEAAYASMGDRRWSRCTSYVRTLSYPGTWLIEYWFYYPFDEGNPHPHIHDSEHLFVEVDKLGGTVRSVLASDHDSFVPNNLYSTLVKDAPPITLPLFAMVELAKHAMVPDLNRDGRFTRGIDDNLHLEPYSFWGLRDRTNKIHFLMEPYTKSMSLPRQRSDRFALAEAVRLFPGLDVPAVHQVCSLQAFPDEPPCSHCDIATAAAGITHLVNHPDARVPESIYKTHVVPWREVRLGVGIYDWSEGRGQLSLAFVGDFRHMTGGLARIPARIALEYSWTPVDSSVRVQLGGKDQYARSKSTMYAGLRLERLVTNTQGFYFGATPGWAHISTAIVNGMVSPAALHWQYTGVSYHVGYLLELPSKHKGNLTNHIGVLIRSAPAYPVLFEWRVSLGFLRQRGRHDFGARPRDRNPYQ